MPNTLYLLSDKVDPYQSVAKGLLAQVRTTAGKNLDSVRTFALSDYWIRPDGYYDYRPDLEERAESYLLDRVSRYLEQRSYTVQSTTVIVVGVLASHRPTFEALATLHGYEIKGS
jgi:hypothetical protein